MKGSVKIEFIKFFIDGEESHGIVDDFKIKEIEGEIYNDWFYTGEVFIREDVEIISPLKPNQIIGIGKNYSNNLNGVTKEEIDNPVLFFKSTSSVVGPFDDIIMPKPIDRIKFEAELAIVIGKEGKHVKDKDALSHVLGYTIANDFTAPQCFHKEGHWFVGKSFDTFLPLGPVIQTEINLSETTIKSRVNNVTKQNSSTNSMIRSIPRIISYISNIITLKAGDVILSGTPAGSEYVGVNDEVECEIENIGRLHNKLV